MANSAEQVGAPERLWDIPRIVSNRQNLQSGWAGNFTLSPTAVTPACWGINLPSGTNAYIWEILFSSDTAISFSVYQVFPASAFTARTANAFINGGAGPAATFRAAVVAAPAVNAQFSSGRVAAGFFGSIVGKGWMVASSSVQLVVVTGTVAATCDCTFFWTELSD